MSNDYTSNLPLGTQNALLRARQVRDERIGSAPILTLRELTQRIQQEIAAGHDVPVYAVTPEGGEYRELYGSNNFTEGQRQLVALDGRLYSYRGYYQDLSLSFDFIDPDKEIVTITASKLLSALRDADGKTFEGYKGGDYFMNAHTPVWLASYGNSGGMMIIDAQFIKSAGILLIITEREVW